MRPWWCSILKIYNRIRNFPELYKKHSEVLSIVHLKMENPLKKIVVLVQKWKSFGMILRDCCSFLLFVSVPWASFFLEDAADQEQHMLKKCFRFSCALDQQPPFLWHEVLPSITICISLTNNIDEVYSLMKQGRWFFLVWSYVVQASSSANWLDILLGQDCTTAQCWWEHTRAKRKSKFVSITSSSTSTDNSPGENWNSDLKKWQTVRRWIM